jgi:protocatechuate 3,4-dioxygenase beta subunit
VSAKDPNISKIGKYLKGQLDIRVMHRLEREAQDDPFLMGALDGYETNSKDQETNLADLKERLAKRVAPKNERSTLLWHVLPIAACLLIMFGAGYWFFSATPDKVQYANVVKPTTVVTKPGNIIQPINPIAKADLNNKTSKKPDLKSPDLLAVQKPKYNVSGVNDLIGRDTATIKAGLPPLAINTVQDNPVGNIEKLLQGKAVQNNPIPNVELLLQGKVAGLNIQNYAGAPGLRGSVNIRGLAADSLNNNSANRFFGAKTKPASISLITGKILDAITGEPMAAATIGSGGKGLTQADTSGRYQVTVNDGSTLVFTYQGYVTQTVKLNPGQKNLNISLTADTKNLSETVIRGYVKRKPDQANNASYIITGKEVQDNPVGHVEQLLQGKVTGLNIQNNAAAKKNLITISGKVTDKNGVPISGALIKNATKFANTDTNGRYRITVNIDSTLRVTSLGSLSQLVKITPGQTTLNLKLEQEDNRLAEVSIRGYVKRSRDQTTGASYIITGKDNNCKENARFKRRFFKKIVIAEQYISEHAAGDTTSTRSGKFLRALKFIKKRVQVSFPTDKTAIGYADLKIFGQNKSEWLKWYEANKCNNLK